MGDHWNRSVAGFGVTPALRYGTDNVQDARLRKVSQDRHVRCAPRPKPAKLGQMRADRINEPGALRHHHIAVAEQKQGSLLLVARYRHKAHGKALRCFADRRGNDCSFLSRFA